MYKIKISYRTGDTFQSHDEEDFIDMEWNEESIAKENLNRVKAHYAMYDWFEDFENRYLTPEKYHNKILSYINEPWFYNDPKAVELRMGSTYLLVLRTCIFSVMPILCLTISLQGTTLC